MSLASKNCHVIFLIKADFKVEAEDELMNLASGNGSLTVTKMVVNPRCLLSSNT